MSPGNASDGSPRWQFDSIFFAQCSATKSLTTANAPLAPRILPAIRPTPIAPHAPSQCTLCALVVSEANFVCLQSSLPSCLHSFLASPPYFLFFLLSARAAALISLYGWGRGCIPRAGVHGSCSKHGPTKMTFQLPWSQPMSHRCILNSRTPVFQTKQSEDGGVGGHRSAAA